MQCSGVSCPMFLLPSARAQRPPILQPVMCCWKLNWRFCSACALAAGWLPALSEAFASGRFGPVPACCKNSRFRDGKVLSGRLCLQNTRRRKEICFQNRQSSARRREAGGGLAWPGGPAAPQPEGPGEPVRAPAGQCIVLAWGPQQGTLRLHLAWCFGTSAGSVGVPGSAGT